MKEPISQTSRSGERPVSEEFSREEAVSEGVEKIDQVSCENMGKRTGVESY